MKLLRYHAILWALLIFACGEDDNPVVEDEDPTVNLLNYAGDNLAAATFQAGTNLAAVYFPSSELEGKRSKQLTEVEFYLGQVPESILLSVRNGNASGDPGDLLYQVTLDSELAGMQWNRLTLPEAINLVDHDELWIILAHTDSDGGSFQGCDAGPQVPNGAMFIGSDGQGAWQNFFGDINWNIRGILTD